MTYTKSAQPVQPAQTSKVTGSPSPELLNVNNYKLVARDLKFKWIALGEIKKVAEVLDFYSDEWLLYLLWIVILMMWLSLNKKESMAIKHTFNL